ncbi:MAG: hypothetical protein M1832_000174 [Thelocarpon impressellum]|nr:MAG: hypothetical protein M1832_000174 [Thelocarpon impressellum]
MADQVVPADVEPGVSLPENLFAGKKFWLSRSVPMRNAIVAQLRAYGGEVAILESKAEIKIVDHLKPKQAPPESYSYEYLTKSMRAGRLEELEDHAVGPPAGTTRDVGSAKPAKGTRTPFTTADDCLLWDWVKDRERSGGKILGLEIYRELAQVNPRHTMQSWRDRWVKYVGRGQRPIAGPPPPAIATTQSAVEADEAHLRREPNESPQATAGGPTDETSTQAADLTTPPARNLRKRALASSPNSPDSPLARKKRRIGQSGDGTMVSSPVAGPDPKTSGDSSVVPLTGQEATSKAQDRIVPPASQSLLSPADESRSAAQEALPVGVFSLPEPDGGWDEDIPDGSPPPAAAPSHAEIRGQKATRQAILNGETQAPDFELPEPEGGWDDDIPYSSPPVQIAVEDDPGEKRHERDTQAILAGETQAPDFGIAEPEGGWQEVLPDEDAPTEPPANGTASPLHAPDPPIRATPATTDDADRDAHLLNAWIDRLISAGASEDDVLAALKYTSMHVGLAQVVLLSLARNEPVPADMPGVWTPQDDDALLGGDGRAIAALERKHGKEAFEARWRFLRDYGEPEEA